jgi:hypothetical protein
LTTGGPDANAIFSRVFSDVDEAAVDGGEGADRLLGVQGALYDVAGAGIYVVQGSRVKERKYLIGVAHKFDITQEIVSPSLTRERETTALDERGDLHDEAVEALAATGQEDHVLAEIAQEVNDFRSDGRVDGERG